VGVVVLGTIIAVIFYVVRKKSKEPKLIQLMPLTVEDEEQGGAERVFVPPGSATINE